MNQPTFAQRVWDFVKTIVIASFLAFFCIRGFVFEPFKIPSGSMMPTLLVGDFLFVSKFAYGNRLPLTDYFFWNRDPARGDIVVFKREGSGLPGSFFGLGDTLFIKRLVGLPGDTVMYKDKVLYINGQPQAQVPLGTFHTRNAMGTTTDARVLTEHLGTTPHMMMVDDFVPGQDVAEMVVPPDMFVLMGDNRDNSRDARYWEFPAWGFVPRADLMGRAEFIWWSWDEAWLPRLDRLFTSLRTVHEEPHAGN